MSKPSGKRNYDDDKAKLKAFLAEFHVVQDNGRKDFVYARQLVTLAHRDAVSLAVDMDHLRQFDPDLAEAIADNTRRSER